MIAKTDTVQKSNCRYCNILKQYTLYKVTAKRGINKKLVTWGTWICRECEELREINIHAKQ